MAMAVMLLAGSQMMFEDGRAANRNGCEHDGSALDGTQRLKHS
jgi:methylaspartate ammonia-lyase